MDLEIAFQNVKNTSREFNGNADVHEKIAQSLLIIEQKLFPEKFEKKDVVEVKD